MHHAADQHTMSRISHHYLKLIGSLVQSFCWVIRLVGPANHGGPVSFGSVRRLKGLPLLRIGQCKVSAECTFALAEHNAIVD